MQSFQRFYRGYGAVQRVLGLVSAAATFVTMLLVVANVTGRYLLNKPLTGTLEFTESLLVVIIFLSVTLTQYDGGHIRVTLLTRRLPVRFARALTLIALVCGAVFFTWCSYAAWLFAVQSWSFNEYEWGTVSFPLYPIKFIVFAGLAMLAFQFLLDAIDEAIGGHPAAESDAMEHR